MIDLIDHQPLYKWQTSWARLARSAALRAATFDSWSIEWRSDVTWPDHGFIMFYCLFIAALFCLLHFVRFTQANTGYDGDETNCLPASEK